jgi:neutral ceramidase
MRFFLSFLWILFAPSFLSAKIQVGVGQTEITPLVGTPSAGYASREGRGMEGVHDPLLALALFIDNGSKKVIFCSVDHLGFTYEMVQEIIRKVHRQKGLEDAEIYIAASHTHSGGGAYLNIPFIGELLAGPYHRPTTQFYINKTVEAILQSTSHTSAAKVGIGYGHAKKLSYYRAFWAEEEKISPLSDVAIIKITYLDNTPLAVLFNYPVHPVILGSENLLFSADFVGYARNHLKSLLGENVQTLFFNGAQGDINPEIFSQDRFEACERLGKSLAKTVAEIWDQTEVEDQLEVQTQKESYTFIPQPTPFGLSLPLSSYASEINLVVLNQCHAFITMPGELSSLYDRQLKETGKALGYRHVSIFGLVNDAHGYIIKPEAWRFQTAESSLSFGGEMYGEEMEQRALRLLLH